MKKILISYCIALSLFRCHNQQNKNTTALKFNNRDISKDTSSITMRLYEYNVNTCLSDLLSAIVKSNAGYYKSNRYFYSVTWNRDKNYRHLNISPDLWDNSREKDYRGVIKFNDGVLLCRGDFESDSIFHKRPNRITIILKQVNSLENSIPISEEPILQGGFYECKGLPIYMEVYAKGDIPAYKMRIRSFRMH